jgi:hypothetical protein
MTEEIVGSHFKSQRGRGQNQDLTGSSTREKSLPPIPAVGVQNASAAPWAGQTRQLAGGNVNPSNVSNHPGMKARDVSDGSPGGVLGSTPARPVKR